MFDDTQKMVLRTKADTNIISDVATKIMGTDTSSLEDNKKLKNNPELHNIFGLAEKLHKSVSEILQMTVDEFNMWIAYFELQRIEQERKNESKGKRGN